MTEKCECTETGFCVRYNRDMTPNMLRICQCNTEQCEKYKTLWIQQRPTLAGDVIHKIAKVTGLDKVANLAAKVMGKKTCGCAERRKKLNELHAKRKGHKT